MQSHLLIGAASSGSGKTTFTLGLLRALKNRSLRVQPFKCGPDYIDTRHHRMAAGVASLNLDRFMMSESHVKDVYFRYTELTDVSVTEGVMGLFDGYDGMKGSSAALAVELEIPVVLVVNAKSTAYSVAPLLYGFKHFNPHVRVAGVVFNFVASDNHYAFLKQAAEDAGVEALGYIPKRTDIEIPSRHLGLSLEEDCCFDTFADRIAALVEQYVDLDRLLELTVSDIRHMNKKVSVQDRPLNKNLRIAVACDAAFNFVYEENIRYLHRVGDVVCFSPLHDKVLPVADFIYFPGGYPEFYLPELAANISLREEIRRFAESGGRILAECGGMMYLSDAIRNQEGISFPMVGLLPQTATMEQMKLKLGYRTVCYGEYCLKGHEFHYSRIAQQEHPLESVAKAYTAKRLPVDTALFRYKNVLAGYSHLYWADPSSNQWFNDFINGKI